MCPTFDRLREVHALAVHSRHAREWRRFLWMERDSAQRTTRLNLKEALWCDLSVWQCLSDFRMSVLARRASGAVDPVRLLIIYREEEFF